MEERYHKIINSKTNNFKILNNKFKFRKTILLNFFDESHQLVNYNLLLNIVDVILEHPVKTV